MTTRLDWLEQTCAELAEERPPLAVPYLVELDGASWTIGSDGHGLIGFREVRTDKVYGAPPMASMAGVLEQRRTGVDAYPIDLVALKEFARAAVPPAPADCPECLGAGTVPCAVCAGVDADECDFCADGREDCETCSDGSRWSPCWLGAVRLNRSVLWKWLNWITEAEPATLWEPPNPRHPRVFHGR